MVYYFSMKLRGLTNYFSVFFIVFAFFFFVLGVVRAEEEKSCENIDLSAETKDSRGICEQNNCEYDSASNKCKTKATSTVVPSTTKNADVTIQFPNPLAGNSANAYNTSIATVTLIARVISAILGILGSISLLVFLVGGLLYLVSQGEESKVKKAVDTLKWALLGLVVVFSAYVILNMALEGLSFITGS